mgnify:CR=1 FL=1
MNNNDKALFGLTAAGCVLTSKICGKRKTQALLWVGAAELLTLSVKRGYDLFIECKKEVTTEGSD